MVLSTGQTQGGTVKVSTSVNTPPTPWGTFQVPHSCCCARCYQGRFFIVKNWFMEHHFKKGMIPICHQIRRSWLYSTLIIFCQPTLFIIAVKQGNLNTRLVDNNFFLWCGGGLINTYPAMVRKFVSISSPSTLSRRVWHTAVFIQPQKILDCVRLWACCRCQRP